MDMNDDKLLLDFNLKRTEENVPVIVFSVVVMTFGILGNVVAMAFYGFHVKTTVTTFLLTTLSANDLVASIMIVGSLVEFFNTVTYHNAAGCKLSYFLGHLFIGNSLLLLVLIALDRYLKIRWALSKVQLTKRSAVVAVAVLFIFGMLYALRDFFFLDSVEIKINLSDFNRTVTGFHCGYSPNPAYQLSILIFHISDIGTVSLNVLTLVVVYVSIGKWILTSRMKVSSHGQNSGCKKGTASKTFSPGTETEMEDCARKKSDKQNKTFTIAFTETLSNAKQNAKGEKDVKPRALRKSKVSSSSAAKLERKLTVMAFVITVASVLSFVPYFILTILFYKLNLSDPVKNELSPSIQIGLRSFMLNSTVNPYIMGLFNREFRHFVVGLLRKLCCRRKYGKIEYNN